MLTGVFDELKKLSDATNNISNILAQREAANAGRASTGQSPWPRQEPKAPGADAREKEKRASTGGSHYDDAVKRLHRNGPMPGAMGTAAACAVPGGVHKIINDDGRVYDLGVTHFSADGFPAMPHSLETLEMDQDVWYTDSVENESGLYTVRQTNRSCAIDLTTSKSLSSAKMDVTMNTDAQFRFLPRDDDAVDKLAELRNHLRASTNHPGLSVLSEVLLQGHDGKRLSDSRAIERIGKAYIFKWFSGELYNLLTKCTTGPLLEWLKDQALVGYTFSAATPGTEFNGYAALRQLETEVFAHRRSLCFMDMQRLTMGDYAIDTSTLLNMDTGIRKLSREMNRIEASGMVKITPSHQAWIMLSNIQAGMSRQSPAKVREVVDRMWACWGEVATARLPCDDLHYTEVMLSCVGQARYALRMPRGSMSALVGTQPPTGTTSATRRGAGAGSGTGATKVMGAPEAASDETGDGNDDEAADNHGTYATDLGSGVFAYAALRLAKAGEKVGKRPVDPLSSNNPGVRGHTQHKELDLELRYLKEHHGGASASSVATAALEIMNGYLASSVGKLPPASRLDIQCRNFGRTGQCKWGDQCAFGHGPGDKRVANVKVADVTGPEAAATLESLLAAVGVGDEETIPSFAAQAMPYEEDDASEVREELERVLGNEAPLGMAEVAVTNLLAAGKQPYAVGTHTDERGGTWRMVGPQGVVKNWEDMSTADAHVTICPLENPDTLNCVGEHELESTSAPPGNVAGETTGSVGESTLGGTSVPASAEFSVDTSEKRVDTSEKCATAAVTQDSKAAMSAPETGMMGHQCLQSATLSGPSWEALSVVAGHHGAAIGRVAASLNCVSQAARAAVTNCSRYTQQPPRRVEQGFMQALSGNADVAGKVAKRACELVTALEMMAGQEHRESEGRADTAFVTSTNGESGISGYAVLPMLMTANQVYAPALNYNYVYDDDSPLGISSDSSSESLPYFHKPPVPQLIKGTGGPVAAMPL